MAAVAAAVYSVAMTATPLTEADLVKRARTTLLVSAAVTLALYLVPYGWYLAYPLMLISTLVHELGHGVAAVLMGGDFHEYHMWADGSGVATSSGVVGGAARAFVSAGGLCGPAVAAAVCLVSARSPRMARWCLGAFGGLLALALILVVRGGFGIVFATSLAGICLFVALRASAAVNQVVLAFLGVQLALSVYSRGDYLFMKWADTAQGRMPSDTQQMAIALGPPYWFWGALCAAFSAAVLVAGSFYFVRGTSSPALPRRRAA